MSQLRSVRQDRRPVLILRLLPPPLLLDPRFWPFCKKTRSAPGGGAVGFCLGLNLKSSMHCHPCFRRDDSFKLTPPQDGALIFSQIVFRSLSNCSSLLGQMGI